MQQIANMLPATFTESDRLIHFLSAKEASKDQSSMGTNSQSSHSSEFLKFQRSLTDWAMAPELRARTKLGPPRTFASALLGDLWDVSLFNISALESTREKMSLIASREVPLEEKIMQSSSFFINSSQLDMEGDNAARAALAASLEQLGALIDGGGLLVSARLVQVLGGCRWPGAFALFSLPGWIRAFSSTLASVAVTQLAICRSIALGHGSEGACRVRMKAAQIIPELFEFNNNDLLYNVGNSALLQQQFSINDPNHEPIQSNSIANVCSTSIINANINHSNQQQHQSDLSAFSVSGWYILLDLRSELYQLVSYLGAIGAISGVVGLTLRTGVASVIGTLTETYFKHGGGNIQTFGSGSNPKLNWFGSTFLLGSMAIIATGLGALTFLKDEDSHSKATSNECNPTPGRFEAHLREKVARSIINNLQKSCWKEYESAAIASIARDTTRSAVLSIQTRFQIRLEAAARRKEARNSYISLLEDRLVYFKSVQRKTNLLLSELESHSYSF